MSRVTGFLAALAAVSGCAGVVAPAAYEPCGDEMIALPGDGRLAAVLTAAGESDWRREIDVGPVKYDDGGVPLVTPESRLAASRSKPRYFGLRIGGTPDVHSVDNEGGGDIDMYEDGPFGGLYLNLARRGGRIALEVGVDACSIKAENFSTGSSSRSFLLIGRTDAVLYVNKGGAARFLTFFGGRYAQEDTEVEPMWWSGPSASYTNTAMGWASGIGIATAHFDFRFEHSEVGDERRVGFEKLMIAFRF